MSERKEPQKNTSEKKIKPPYTFRERVLYKIAKGILNLDHFSITDDLIELGMDDAMIDALAEGAVEKGICLSAEEIKKHRTIEMIIRGTNHICKWLDGYFAGLPPDWLPPMRLDGATPFRRVVSDEMRRIPFGKTVTYGDIAKSLAARFGKSKMSAQAVGGAIGWNPICIIIPCHRVIGAGGKLIGYGGGMRNKIALLKHEGAEP